MTVTPLYVETRDRAAQVPMTTEEWDRLTALARRLGRSRANLLRRALLLAEEHADTIAAEPVPGVERWREG